MKNIVVLLPALALIMTFTLLSGCNTIDGVGRDISYGASTVGGWVGAKG
ncbi:MAG: entericidin [Rhodobacteraceae bacterium]|nr:entericidin [Paracoccaceae bacterium]